MRIIYVVRTRKALWATVSALGDRDTTCAIVGGAVVLRTGIEGVPSTWRSAREALPSRSSAKPPWTLSDGHAEIDIVSNAKADGLKLMEIGATRPVCPGGVLGLQEPGAIIVTPSGFDHDNQTPLEVSELGRQDSQCLAGFRSAGDELAVRVAIKNAGLDVTLSEPALAAIDRSGHLRTDVRERLHELQEELDDSYLEALDALGPDEHLSAAAAASFRQARALAAVLGGTMSLDPKQAADVVFETIASSPDEEDVTSAISRALGGDE